MTRWIILLLSLVVSGLACVTAERLLGEEQFPEFVHGGFAAMMLCWTLGAFDPCDKRID